MARRFRFNLEALLSTRRLHADACRRTVADRLRQIGDVDQQLAVIDRQIGQEMTQVRRAATQPLLDVAGLSNRRFWIVHLQRAEAEARERRAQLDAELAKERELLAQAVKEKRVLERLRDRALERHQRSQSLEDQAETDEIALMRWHRCGPMRNAVDIT